MLRKELHQQNRLSWNEATKAHNSHKKNQAEFFRSGGSTLFQEECDLLGDINGKTLVHLQCNSGQDSLSLAKLGAIVTGVDISDTAIDFACCLSDDSGIHAKFFRADVFDWLAEKANSDQRYQVVFSSYGSLVWLSDIFNWATGVKRILTNDGRVVLIDFHPYAMIFDWDWSLKLPYFGEGKPFKYEDGVGDYVALSGRFLTPSGYLKGIENFKNPHPVSEFQWTMSDVISALLEAGLNLEIFKEYPYMNGAILFKSMHATQKGRMYPPPGFPTLPLMYGLVASVG